MKRNFVFLSLSFLFICISLFGEGIQPDSAHSILKSALEKARESNRNVFIIYRATWCSWCNRLDSVLQESDIKEIFDEHYVTINLDIRERGEKIKTRENPGAYETLIKYGGEKSGIPFMVFLDSNGKMIANSNVLPNKENIGYPATDADISAFIKLLKRTAPRMTKKQRAVITEHFKKSAPK